MAHLLAGMFRTTPAYIQIMRAGMVGFFDADNEWCWTDPNGRTLVNDINDARALLDAHGYRLGDEIQPESEGAVRLNRFRVHSKAETLPQLPAHEPVDELSQLRKAFTNLHREYEERTSRIAALEAALAKAQEWDEHHPAYIAGAKAAVAAVQRQQERAKLSQAPAKQARRS